MENNNVTLA
jgi:hypothetical protein